MLVKTAAAVAALALISSTEATYYYGDNLFGSDKVISNVGGKAEVRFLGYTNGTEVIEQDFNQLLQSQARGPIKVLGQNKCLHANSTTNLYFRNCTTSSDPDNYRRQTFYHHANQRISLVHPLGAAKDAYYCLVPQGWSQGLGWRTNVKLYLHPCDTAASWWQAS
ncbi:hypothetical protein HK097_000283 [Rhizophlyctis rosea]|uniref:Uncharacterized protein n=1 Tax=Rhizophlyctis rosea TaxID=64517 RepID=A0AAD5X246_9FUNG|nr:hypothetical protein HK097_000283 [Rhizophlyctis rosea]